MRSVQRAGEMSVGVSFGVGHLMPVADRGSSDYGQGGGEHGGETGPREEERGCIGSVYGVRGRRHEDQLRRSLKIIYSLHEDHLGLPSGGSRTPPPCRLEDPPARPAGREPRLRDARNQDHSEGA